MARQLDTVSFSVSDVGQLFNKLAAVSVLVLDVEHANMLVSNPADVGLDVDGQEDTFVELARVLLNLSQSDEYRDVLESERHEEKLSDEYRNVNELEHNEEKLTEERSEEAHPLYVPCSSVYSQLEPDDNYQQLESRANSNENLTSSTASTLDVATSFYNELFPTKKVTQKVEIHGFFPDIEDFTGGIEQVGSGFSGLVFKSTLRGQPVVLKVSRQKSEVSNRADYHEWSVSDRLKPHPNVLRVIGLCPSFKHASCVNAGTTAIISPWQENGALREFYNKRAQQENDIQNIALGMIQGIRSLHEQRVVHRDVAVRNFLVDTDGKVLLCDFGLSRFLPEGHDCIHSDNEQQNVALPWRYLAPESFDGVFCTKSDIWMYGLTLLELIDGIQPWSSYRTPLQLKVALQSQTFQLGISGNIDPSIRDIIRDCCQFEPSDRPTADEIAERLVKWQFRLEDLNRDVNGNTDLQQFLLTEVSDSNFVKMEFYQDPFMVNAVNAFDETPLMLAKHNTSLQALLNYNKIPICNEEPSRHAAYHHNIDLFTTLLKLAEKEDTVTLKNISSCGDLSRFSKHMYLHRGDSNGETPLHISARAGNTSLFDAFMSLNLISEEKQNGEGHTVLHIACLCGHENVVHKLLLNEKHANDAQDQDRHKSYVDVNIQDNRGKTALHLAAKRGHRSIVSMLLQYHQINVNVRDVSGQTPIFDTVDDEGEDNSAKLSCLEEFLNNPFVDITLKNSRGESVVHRIASMDSLQAAKLVLQHAGIQAFEHGDKMSRSSLHIAVSGRSWDVAKLLLSLKQLNLNQKDINGNTPLHTLCEIPVGTSPADPEVLARCHKLHDIATVFLSRDEVDITMHNLRGDTPLHVAAKSNNYPVTKVLLRQQATEVHSQSNPGETPVHVAEHVNSSIVSEHKILHARDDVDPNARGEFRQTPLGFAVCYDSVEVAKILLARDDVDPNVRDANQRTPLHYAASDNRIEIANILLEIDEVDHNARDVNQQTPLHYAASGNCIEIAKILLERDDVDPNARDKFQLTLLHFAAIKSQIEFAKILLARDDVDPNARSKFQQTPLHVAANSNSIEVAKILLERDDVDPNARDEDGKTPLHEAAFFDSIDVTKMFLARNDVDHDARDVNGHSALQTAEESKSHYVAEFLKSLSLTHDP